MPWVHLQGSFTKRRESFSHHIVTRLILSFLLVPYAFAISLRELSAVPSLDSDASADCQTVYQQTIPSCTNNDFQGATCSTACIGSLASVVSLFRQACDLTDKPALSKWEIFKTGASIAYICNNGVTKSAAPSVASVSSPPATVVPASSTPANSVPAAGVPAVQPSVETVVTTLVLSATLALPATPPPPPPAAETVTQLPQTIVSTVTSVSVMSQPTKTESITQTVQITTTAAAPPPAMTSQDPALMSTMASYMSAMSSMGLTTMTATPQATATNDPAMSSYMSSM